MPHFLILTSWEEILQGRTFSHFVLHMKALLEFLKIHVFGLICSKEDTDENLFSVFFGNSCFADEHFPAVSLEN